MNPFKGVFYHKIEINIEIIFHRRHRHNSRHLYCSTLLFPLKPGPLYRKIMDLDTRHESDHSCWLGPLEIHPETCVIMCVATYSRFTIDGFAVHGVMY